MNPTQERFESWAILELMGHQKMAGLVTEANVAGKGFLRIDVYDAAGESVLFSRMVNPDSVYAINPVERSIALAVGADSHRPVTCYEVSHLLPPAPAPTPPFDTEDENRDEVWGSDEEWEEHDEAQKKKWSTKDSPPRTSSIF